mmetsp:Transcript_4650/g.8251  ORF Transcript_4650/g.8251 Transcript_4650/m.8251 type:complete len:498 (+) Transcript_4650:66-1559(+)
MGGRPVLLSRAFAIAALVGIVCVIFPEPLLQRAGNASGKGESTLLQLEGRFDGDESSFIQVSDTVNRRSLVEQQTQVSGAAAEDAAKERPAEQPAVSMPHTGKDSLAALQVGSQTRVMMSSFVEMGRHAESAHNKIKRTETRDPMLAVTIIVFALCGVALLLIFFKLFTDKDDELYPSQRESMNMKLTGERSRSPQLASSYGVRQADTYNRPSMAHANSPGMYRKDPYNEPRGSSPSMPQSLPPAASKSPIQTGVAGPGSPGYGADYRAPSSQQLLDSQRASAASAPPKLSSELHGAIVPAKRKFMVKIPSLLMTFPSNTEISRQYSVHTKDNIEMLKLKVLRHKPNPHDNPDVHIEEYMTLSMPPELDKELVVCTFGRVAGNSLICEIYKSDNVSGSKLYGILQEEPTEEVFSGSSTYVLWLATEPATRLLTITVSGKISDRNIKILDGRNASSTVASTVSSGAGEIYECECYPHSDVLLVVLALAGVDRIVAHKS